MTGLDRRTLMGAAAAGAASAAASPALAGWSEPPAAAVIDPRRLGRLDALLESLVAKGMLPCAAVQISQHGKVLHEHRAGYADVATREPIGADAIYRIYSMTKPVTATAVMMLYEDGALLLNDPVAKYVPEFAKLTVYAGGEGAAMTTQPAQPMTIAHLLTHTSGLSNSWNPGHVSKLYGKAGLPSGTWYHDPTLNGLGGFAERLATVPLEFQPGSRWLYSYSPDVAGLIVERVSGMRFGDFLAKRLFQPLEMKDTAFQVAPEKLSRLPVCYTSRNGALIPIEDRAHSPYGRPPAADSGAAGLVSTLSDYGRFSRMLAAGGAFGGVRILSQAGAALMMSSQVPAGVLGQDLVKFAPFGLGGSGGGLGYALCGAVVTDVGLTHGLGVLGEYSWGGAASTTFWVAPKLDLSVVFMTQLLPSGTFPLQDWLKAAVYQALIV